MRIQQFPVNCSVREHYQLIIMPTIQIKTLINLNDARQIAFLFVFLTYAKQWVARNLFQGLYAMC